ncbi:hypothetical protein WMY93_007270 [Mugilogobius chulae]|uniref:Uncharacterized protein n=1 Tax=Mugilogobius chulae TaxID=88201 RepID=A0AAW0PMC3_9GOBI
MGTTWMSYAACFILTLVHLNAAQEPKCHTYHESGKTVYKVSTQLHPEEHNCEHSWSNDTNFVLANGVGHDDTVLKNTNTSLELSVCLNVTYELNCASGSQLDQTRHRTVCVVNCTAKPQNLKYPIGTRGHVIPLTVVAICIFVVCIVIIAMCVRRTVREHELVQA